MLKWLLFWRKKKPTWNEQMWQELLDSNSPLLRPVGKIPVLNGQAGPVMPASTVEGKITPSMRNLTLSSWIARLV